MIIDFLESFRMILIDSNKLLNCSLILITLFFNLSVSVKLFTLVLQIFSYLDLKDLCLKMNCKIYILFHIEYF